MSDRAIVVEFDLVSGLGESAEATWRELLAGRSGIRHFPRLPTSGDSAPSAAFVEGLDPNASDTMIVQMLRPLLERRRRAIPSDARLLLATTNGEIDLLERVISGRGGSLEDSVPSVLARKVQGFVRLDRPGLVISAACASSTVALAEGAAMIRSGEVECVLVVACDHVSEFVAAGFGSLGALAPDGARPFDRGRRGLSLGEAAGYVLLMGERRARKEERALWAEVSGWGTRSDADHITAPAESGRGLEAAVRKALAVADIEARDVGSICAHGTGTRSNDAMEMRAFERVFGARPVPTYSVKGALGHTMGTAGLVDAIQAVWSLSSGLAPPTVGLREPEENAQGWVAPSPQPCASPIAVSTNSGFGGVNCALVLEKVEAR